MFQSEPSLTNYDEVPITKFFTHVDYSSKSILDLVEGKEFLLKESSMDLKDSTFGLIDI